MSTQHALHPQDQISHYRIVGPLGTGGMGEVYLAQDQTLERNVALKILPPELVRSEDRVRRFVREAKSASSLNHPNIVTIYEIGQDQVRGPDGASGASESSSSLYFISMELVSGETLSTKIHQDKTDLRTLLGYLAQAAEGLAKAHAAGIVHRDLKPGNIMVSKDGFAKVLDFGLAKLTEKGATEADATIAPSDDGDSTGVGSVVGTAGYMAPEQIRGASVDHRADIFSFGCILYEAATRRKPFIADSGVETMHKILHEKPPEIADLNAKAPAELRRLIRRCLAKNPEQRLQSAKDLAIELREIVDEYDALSPSGSSASGSSATSMASPGRKRVSPVVLAGGGLLLAALVVAGVLLLRRGDNRDTAGQPLLRISPVTSRGQINGAALSPDGRYLAYSMSLDGIRSLWVRQVATGSDVQILGAQSVPPTGLIFAPGGDYLYYQSSDPDREGYTAIFEIPTLGGTPRKRAYDVDSRVTFSPDGKRMAFRRGVPNKKRDDLILRDVESGQERVLAHVADPVTFGQPAWSPDGKRIAIAEIRGGVALGASVATYGVADGRRQPVGKAAFLDMADLAWLPDGKGLIASAFDPATLQDGQLWKIGFPDGRVARITSDASLYAATSVSADGASIAAARFRQELDLWITTPADARMARQVTFGSGEGSVENWDEGPDSTIVYSTVKDGIPQIISVRQDGASERSLTQGQKIAIEPKFRPGVGIIYRHADDDLTLHIWRMDATGENARSLTSGTGESLGDVSRDGRVILLYRDDMRDVVWTLSPDGGAPVRRGVSTFNSAVLSPDGTRVLSTLIHEVQGQGAFTPQIISLQSGETSTPGLPPRANDAAWTPDGTAITYLHDSNERRNLYLLPLDGGAPREITHFKDGRIQLHRWSPDGKRLVVRRKIGNADNLWVVGADGSNPVAVTNFETGSIGDMKWSRDGTRILFTYGLTTQNVVLIRNFSGRS